MCCLKVFIVLLYLYLSDFFLVPSALGIKPFAFRCALSVKPALPALYRAIASAVFGAFSLSTSSSKSNTSCSVTNVLNFFINLSLNLAPFLFEQAFRHLLVLIIYQLVE